MKPFYRSRTLWGAAIVVVTTLAQLFASDVDVGGATGTAADLATLIGGVIVVIGRTLANGQIRWRA